MHHNIIVIQVLERVDNVTHLPASDLHTHRLTARGYSATCTIQHLSFLTSCDIRQKFMVPKYFC